MQRLRNDAKRAGRSLSAHIAELASGKTPRRRWPPGFDKLFGSWVGEFPAPEDTPFDEREPMA
jgi:hypothetical protein